MIDSSSVILDIDIEKEVSFLEMPNKAKFAEFYTRLENTRDIYYMFFTTGMLFWVAKSISYIPADVNLVLLCAGLDEEERAWINTNYRFPVFYIDEYTDDNSIWNMLFAVNKKNFGWIDCDCFVLNPGIFAEMTTIDDDVFANVCWANADRRTGKELLNSYFVFINQKALRAMGEAALDVSPGIYLYPGDTDKAKRLAHMYPFILEPQHMPFILAYQGGYPMQFSETGDDGYFDTLLISQFVAAGLGYRLHRVRSLSNAHYASNDLLHVGGSSNFSEPYQRVKSNNVSVVKYAFNIRIYQIAAYLILDGQAGRLPAKYTSQRNLQKKLLELAGYTRDSAQEELTSFLVGNGVRNEVVRAFIETENVI